MVGLGGYIRCGWVIDAKRPAGKNTVLFTAVLFIVGAAA